MKARYVQRGESIDYTPTADVAAGDVVQQGKLVGVAKLDIKANELGALALCGVYEFTVKTGDSIAVGDTVYFDKTAGTITKTGATGLIPFGFAVTTGSGDGLCNVRLEQGLDAVTGA